MKRFSTDATDGAPCSMRTAPAAKVMDPTPSSRRTGVFWLMGTGGVFSVSDDESIVRGLAHRIAADLLASPDRFGDTWDFDEVFWKDYPAPWDIRRALDSFRQLVDASAEWTSQLVPTLIVNLAQSRGIDRAMPDLTKLDHLDLSPAHPPSLGLAKTLRPASIAYEHYRVPVRQDLIAIAPGEVRTYYECWRTIAAMTADEPYDRAVIFQYWGQ